MRRFCFIIFAIILILIVGSPVVFAESYSKILEKAKQGDMIAQFEVGELYRTGVNFPKNYKQAYIWFSLSAAQGNKEAQKKINSLEDKLTPQQVGEAQDMAVLKQQFIEVSKKTTSSPKKPIVNEKTLKGEFIENSKSGFLFVVTGQVKNITTKTIQHIKVKASLQANNN